MARIMLVDDDVGTLDTMRRALELDGHQITVSSDGAEALSRLAAEGPFGALVTDVELPGLDGLTLAKEARTALPGIRIIVVSGHAEALEKVAGLGIPGARCVAKPFTIERIRAEVRAALT